MQLKLWLHIVIAAGVITFLGGGLAASGQEKINSCMECHGDKKVEFLASVHVRSDLTCTTCHGGDPSRLDRSAHRNHNFRGKPDRSRIPQFCGSCHSQENLMRQYGLPTDQLRQYLTSQHGRALVQKKDLTVAVCTDCHGTHKILARTDPQSSIYAANVPATCARCHSNEKLMKNHGLPFQSFADYRDSIHGAALLQKKNLLAPNCAFCHGTHGAAPPGVTEVANVCGQCHGKERAAFKQSVHKAAMDRQQIKECISCHDHHRIAKATPVLYDRLCQRCHPRDSAAFKTGQQIQESLVGTQEAIAAAQKTLIEGEEHGLDMQAQQLRLRDAQALLAGSYSVTHTLSPGEVGEFTRQARSIAEEVKTANLALFREENIWMAIRVAVGLLLLLALAAVAAFLIHLRRLYSQPVLDKVTGLPGPAYFHTCLWNRFYRSRLLRRWKFSPFSLLLIEIDNFGDWERRFGIPTREQVTARVAGALKQSLRRHDCLARYDDDRFVAILDCIDLDEARRVAERLQRKMGGLSLPPREDRPLPQVTISVGITLLQRQDQRPYDLILRARQALNSCTGGNCIGVANGPVG